MCNSHYAQALEQSALANNDPTALAPRVLHKSMPDIFLLPYRHFGIHVKRQPGNFDSHAQGDPFQFLVPIEVLGE